jgi:hypothetical protein
MDHSRHTRLTDLEMTESNIMHAAVYGLDDSKIGTVSHVHGYGPDRQIIIDVGGFLGIGSKSVALSFSQLDFMRDEDGDVHAVTSFTKDQLKALPEHHH